MTYPLALGSLVNQIVMYRYLDEVELVQVGGSDITQYLQDKEMAKTRVGLHIMESRSTLKYIRRVIN